MRTDATHHSASSANITPITPRTNRTRKHSRTNCGWPRGTPNVESDVSADKLGKISAADTRRHTRRRVRSSFFATFTLPDVKPAFWATADLQVYFLVMRNNPFDLCTSASLHICLQGP